VVGKPFPGINHVALSGHVVGTPDFSVPDGEDPLLIGAVQVFHAYTDRVTGTEGPTPPTSTFTFAVSRNAARHFATRLKEGSPIFLAGVLRSDPEDGSVLIVVRNLQLLDLAEER